MIVDVTFESFQTELQKQGIAGNFTQAGLELLYDDLSETVTYLDEPVEFSFVVELARQHEDLSYDDVIEYYGHIFDIDGATPEFILNKLSEYTTAIAFTDSGEQRFLVNSDF